jgi:hypothetical protein
MSPTPFHQHMPCARVDARGFGGLTQRPYGNLVAAGIAPMDAKLRWEVLSTV